MNHDYLYAAANDDRHPHQERSSRLMIRINNYLPTHIPSSPLFLHKNFLMLNNLGFSMGLAWDRTGHVHFLWYRYSCIDSDVFG
ncbi:hypothetical protein EYC80_009093 [Monilinia laxa]|uniref:Uncharacterized protein n=1 Tax=Monilinia laxa TaxID=61186 RepID=A0A5N6K2D9_MONLA|nr:hypothetical protein EYC80_009093 [Monilinia laxa]